MRDLRMKAGLRNIKAAFCFFGLALLGGCTSTSVPTQSPANGSLTMTQIYDSTAGSKQVTPMDGANIEDVRGQVATQTSSAVHYADYTRTADNEVSNLFKPLPNPQIPVYIFPHLAQTGSDDLPVPGYTTAFFLYPHEEYALPSEVQ